jgi:hypothetical protein
MDKRIKELIKKDITTKDLSDEELLEIQTYFQESGLVYEFTQKEICHLCKNKPHIEYVKFR